MPPSENYAGSVNRIIELTEKTLAVLEAGDTEAFSGLAEENRHITKLLAELEPTSDDLETLDLLVEARERIVQVRAALESRHADLVEERQALDARRKIGRAYGPQG